jgi:hypothetical protein
MFTADGEIEVPDVGDSPLALGFTFELVLLARMKLSKESIAVGEVDFVLDVPAFGKVEVYALGEVDFDVPGCGGYAEGNCGPASTLGDEVTEIGIISELFCCVFALVKIFKAVPSSEDKFCGV